MFSASELASMAAEVEGSLGAASGLGVSVALIRGGAARAAQDARLVRPRGAGEVGGGQGTESAQAVMELVGAADMDIRARDRFTLNGQSYEVVAVLPQRQIGTVAQVRSLQ